MLQNKYGYFDEKGKEFVITEPRTPRPWFNYMWNEHYGGLISHTGGGFSFLDCPRDNRINRMRYNSLPWDRPGRYVIVKDVKSGEYWSLSWAPTIEIKYDKYECRHGLGYTKITTEYKGIRGEITYFVPTDKNMEIWRVSLTDLTNSHRELEVYSFTELMMGNALNDIINQPNDKHFTDIRFDKNNQTLVSTRRYWVLNKKVSVAQPNIDWKYNLYFTQTLPIEGFDGSLDAFIGRWRSEANPVAIETGKMGNTEITAGEPVAAVKSLVNIAGGKTVDFSVLLGVVEKTEEEPYEILDWKKLNNVKHVDLLFSDLKNKFKNNFNKVVVETPDEAFNLMQNTWNKHQTTVTFDMARNAGFYHGGLLFGTGIRDRFQDILGVVTMEPERVRPRLIDALKFQFSDGSTLHNYFKLTGSGERTHHSDTPLWISFGIIEYLNETGDLSILDEVVEFHDEGAATVYEHMVRSLDYAIAATTERGMPKMMNGDWNDTLDHIGPKGKGETVWGAFFLAYALKKTFELLEIKNDTCTLERWKNACDKLEEVTNKYCWDGEWYLRAFRDNGESLGSSKHKQGKIFLNAQTWSVISGLATKERADSALESCEKHLKTPYGMQIVSPSYTEIEDNIGLISRCVPGKKENGAVFNHASAWYVLAALLNGNAENAWEIYSRMLPVNSSREIDKYEIEPYVFAEYVTSPDHPTENQASHSWLTGSAVWMYRIGLDYILGLNTSIKGITISPNIPSSWKEYKVSREFRGKVIDLVVKNPDGGNSKIKEIKINGEIVHSPIITIDEIKAHSVNVEVILQ